MQTVLTRGFAPAHEWVRLDRSLLESYRVWFDRSMTLDPMSSPAVLQLRLVVETDDFDGALRFYRDALGLTEQAAYEGEGDARVVILDAGRATLELVNAAQRRMIDRIEVGHDASPRLRVAFEVPDCRAATASLSSAGATVIGDPGETPWRSLNARLEAPAGLQLTLFEELGAQPVEA
jgi:catechol 2,3-dioxygenase-like lactoylglutathione lyase family enzyme